MRGCHARLVYALGAIVPNRVDVAAVHFCHRGYRARTGRLAPAGVPAVRRLNTAANRLVAIAAERWSYRHGRVRVLAAVSPGAAAEARRHFRGVDVRIVPNGVDSARFRADGRVRRELRERNGISESETVVLFMGGDWERKGLPIAVEALGLLSPELQREVNLWVVGRGDAARLRRLARLHGVERRVTCFGVTAEPERFYAAADVLVLPSEYETFSLVAYEAAAAGVPVVASAVSGVEDLVGSDDAGLLVDLSPEAVSTALARVATDRTLLRTLGEAARRRSEGYTWEAAGESLDRVFAGLLERESRW